MVLVDTMALVIVPSIRGEVSGRFGKGTLCLLIAPGLLRGVAVPRKAEKEREAEKS